MRLKQIKLAGFKSFVDPTTVRFPGDRSAVVGPNGCGKSNIIDAVRWVMGESSAKQLRGESLTDVIFNGSAGRKPTALASIELLFDNSDGRIGGEYASYADIAIRREVSRDAQSQYYINGRKCRRRDILDVFLGTGFGPRSYSIIEQGMISQLVEAKPDELRNYLEEAAGISKYKERRRETENRLRHTLENLDRLNDIRDELDKQLTKLKRQANNARIYRELKQEQRRLAAELLSLRMTALGQELDAGERQVAELVNRQAEKQAEMQAVDTDIEKSRQEMTARGDEFSGVQSRFYQLGAEIARVEEALQYNEQRLTQLELDLDAVTRSDEENRRQLALDDARIGELGAQASELQPQLEAAQTERDGARAALTGIEDKVAAWQSDWDAFSAEAAGIEQRAQVQAARIDSLDNLIARLSGRAQQLDMQLAAEGSGDLLAPAEIEELAREIERQEVSQRARADEAEAVLAELAASREAVLQAERQLEDLRTQLADERHALASLEALQQAALGRHNTDVQSWLDEQQLAGGARLGEQLSVVPGWELAVEAVLGADLQAIRVTDIDRFAQPLAALPSGTVTLFEGRTQTSADGDLPLLATMVHGDRLGIGSLLEGVFAAQSVEVALAHRRQLGNGHSIITRDGLWFGPDWVRALRGDADETGIIQRAQDIENLSIQLENTDQQLLARQGELTAERDNISRLERRRDELQTQSSELDRTIGKLRADLGVGQVRIEEAQARRERLNAERAEIDGQVEAERALLTAARAELVAAESAREGLGARRAALGEARESNTRELESARSAAREADEKFHKLNSERQAIDSHLSASQTARERLQSQQGELVERKEAIESGIQASREPMPELKQDLDSWLEERVGVEAQMGQMRSALDQVEAGIREHEERRGKLEAQSNDLRDELEIARVARQGLTVKAEGLQEQFRETGLEFDAVQAALPEDASEPAWVESLEKMERRISRLGAINLAAIDEYESESERKTYLDNQHADLEEALDTLQTAIKKIDKETRTRFKTTFEAVNTRLGQLFPKVFGGGHANLELTGEDLLDTGVALMARPPGKRNASVHLLSGGEKALTAIALIFAIFHLNPSPVCMLDEVDAPLDDSNVVRFADLIKEMSADVQFVVITHNKLTMEMADHLMGVTMHEAGVSRLVSVDVDRAVELAAV
ncbi:MAG: chromosome segregation protein SMC [Pseudomonadota bacterium]